MEYKRSDLKLLKHVYIQTDLYVVFVSQSGLPDVKDEIMIKITLAVFHSNDHLVSRF